MLKHVQISPHRNRSDSMSLRSSTSCASSLCGSPEPPIDSFRSTSRASSCCSLNESIPQTTIKVYTNCLKLDIEYKTLGIQWDTTSKHIISQILRRCKMHQRDSRLFYLSMEVTVRKANVKTILQLDDDARPAILQACHPKGDSRFCLQIKPGGLIRVHTSVLEPTSLYKSLFISNETTADELLTLLLSCYNVDETVEQYSLYEVCNTQEYQRKLHPDDLPLRAQQLRKQRGEECHFIVRKNLHYNRRRQILAAAVEAKSTPNGNARNPTTLTPTCVYTKPAECHQNSHTDLSYTRLSRISTSSNLNESEDDHLMKKLPNSCFSTTYNPVYNIREIHTVCSTFSSIDGDKRFWPVSKRNSMASVASSPMNIIHEEVLNNPAKGYGSYVYI